MPANTRARTPLRATLNVETLEGRAMPSAVIVNHPNMVDPGVVRVATSSQGVYVAGLSVAKQLHNPGAMRVVSRIVVNGEVVAKFVGKPQFAAMGPALSTDANGIPVSAGGTTVCVNGRTIGTFQQHPTVTRDVMVYVNRHGVAARVLTYRVTGQVYLPPSNPADLWVDCYPSGV
jgi:hypothetical protein